MRALALCRLIGTGVLVAGFVSGAHMIQSAQAAGAIQVSGAYALADSKSPRLGYVYLTISAPKGVTDALIGAQSPAAASVVLVDSSHHNAHPKSDEIPQIEINGHAPLVLQPHGPHFVLRGMAAALRQGKKIHIVLEFRKAAAIDVPVDVLGKPPAAGAPQLPKGVKID